MVNKKIPTIILSAVALIGLGIAISRIGNDSPNTHQSLENRQNIPSSAIPKNQNSHWNDSDDNSYEIIKKTFTSPGVKITYPQITRLSDPYRQEKINQLIKTEALKVLQYYPEAKQELSLKIDDEIKWKNENLLSIQYSGVGYMKGAAYPNNLFYTTNINIPQGRKLQLKDLVIIDETLINKFKSGGLKALKPEHNDILQGLTDNELIEKLNKADSPDYPSGSDIFSYFTKNSLGLSFSAPHALGDHAEFEIKYPEIKNNLKFDNI